MMNTYLASRWARIVGLMPRRAWIVLGIALAVGLIAALGARSYLSAQLAALEAKNRVSTVNLVVAKNNLRRGDKLSSETVAIRAVPADYAHADALRPADYERFDGNVLAAAVKAGDAVLWSMLESRRKAALAGQVEPGRRAFTLAVDEVSAVSGLLEPGDRIDLLVTAEHKGHKFTWTILQGLRVLAVGGRVIDEARTSDRKPLSTLTLEASLQETQRVVAAREVGKLTAVLRNAADQTSVATRPEDLPSVAGLHAANLAQALAGLQQVPVLYGGRGASMVPEALELGRRVQGITPAQLSQGAGQDPSATTTGLGSPSPFNPGTAVLR